MSTTTKAEVLDLAGLITYQEGSVVSRQIIKTEAGNVTLFAFDQGQELTEHSAPFDALVHIIDGQAEINVSGEAFHLNAGEVILMPANDPHAVRATKKFKMLLTMIKT